MKQYRVIIEPEAQNDLTDIYTFIATNDTVVQAQRFLRKLKKGIDSLGYMPYRFRSSIYIKEEHVRDMTLEGYTICYGVIDDIVHILTVFRQKEL